MYSLKQEKSPGSEWKWIKMSFPAWGQLPQSVLNAAIDVQRCTLHHSSTLKNLWNSDIEHVKLFFFKFNSSKKCIYVGWGSTPQLHLL